MSVFKPLAEAHGVLKGIVGRLERADEKEARGLLLVLLKALDAHEEIEGLVFEDELAPALIAERNLALRKIRTEAQDALERLPHEDPVNVRALSRRLARTLRRQFADEERVLWPTVNATAGRTRLHRLDREVRGRVRAMKKELDSYLTAVEDYLT